MKTMKNKEGVMRTSSNQQERETKTRTYLMAYSLAIWCIHDGAIPLGAWCYRDNDQQWPDWRV